MNAELRTELYTSTSLGGHPSGAIAVKLALSLEKPSEKVGVLDGEILLDLHGRFRVHGAISVYGGHLTSFVQEARSLARRHSGEAVLLDLDFGTLFKLHRLGCSGRWHVTGSWDKFGLSHVKIPVEARNREMQAPSAGLSFRFQGLTATDEAVGRFLQQLEQIIAASNVSQDEP